MKTLLLILLICPFIANAQSDFIEYKENWSAWQSTNCYQGLDFSLKKIYYTGKTGKYKWQVRFRNRYNESISFNCILTESSVSSAKGTGRVHIETGQIDDGTGSWFLVADSKVNLFVTDFRFGEDTGPYASCGSTTNNLGKGQTQNANSTNQNNYVEQERLKPQQDDKLEEQQEELRRQQEIKKQKDAETVKLDQETSNFLKNAKDTTNTAIGQNMNYELAKTNLIYQQQKGLGNQADLQGQLNQINSLQIQQNQTQLNQVITSTGTMIAGLMSSSYARKMAEDDKRSYMKRIATIEADQEKARNLFKNKIDEFSELLKNVKGELVICPATNCLGKGFYPCTQCNSQGFPTCHSCNGSGQTSFETPGLYLGSASTTSYITCTYCEGTGKEYCKYCSGFGKEQCGACNGTGKMFKADRQWVDSASAQGNLYAQLERGIASVGNESLEWITKAARQNYPKAYFILATRYSYGWGLAFEKSELKTKENMSKARELGFAPAMANTPSYLFDEKVFFDYIDGAKWNYKGAQLGDANAIYNVKQYEIDFNEQLAGATTGSKMFKYSHDNIELKIAMSYDKGIGTAANKVEAIKWYLKVKKGGSYALSKYCLGTIYEEGTGGVAKDISRATKYYKEAAKGGNSEAIKCLQRLGVN